MRVKAFTRGVFLFILSLSFLYVAEAQIVGAVRLRSGAQPVRLGRSASDPTVIRTLGPNDTLYNLGCNNSYCKLTTRDRRYTFWYRRTSLIQTARYDRRGGGGYIASSSFGSELGSGASYRPSSGAGGSTGGSSSRFLSCYRNKGLKYPALNNCTSGDRMSTGCHGFKSPTRSTGYCYRYVKLILQDCGATSGYIGGTYAKNAGPELVRQGFRKLNVSSPREAPNGAVLVYGNVCSSSHPAGHIEIKVSSTQYVSDYIGSRPVSENTRCRPFLGAYMK